MHGNALIHNGLLFLHRNTGIAKLWNMPYFHDNIFVRCQLLLSTSCRQYCGLTHHLLHRSHGTVIIESDAGSAGCYQTCQNS